MLRTAGVIVLSLLLCLSLFGANAALGLDRGPMDADHMSDSLDESGVYEHAYDEIVQMMQEEAADTRVEGFDVSIDSVLEDVLEPELIQREVEQNLDGVYAYLEGDSDELIILLDLESVEGDARSALEREIDSIEYGEFGYDRVVTIMESEEAYERERMGLRGDLLIELGFDPDAGFGDPLLADLISDESSYDERIEEFQEQAPNGDAFEEAVRDEVDVELPEGAPETLEPEVHALEELVVDAITEEREYSTFMAGYEGIATDIETKVAAHAWENRDEYRDEIDTLIGEPSNVPDPVADELDEFEEIALEAVLTDLSYEDFLAEIATAESGIVDAVVSYVFEDEDVIPSEIDLTDDIEGDAGDEIDIVQAAAGAIGPVAIGLFLFSGILIAGVYAISRDPATTAIAGGISSTLVGAGSAVGTTLLPGLLGDLLRDADPPEGLPEVLQDLFASLLSPWATQSLLLLFLGVALTILGCALRVGYIELGALGFGEDTPAEEIDETTDGPDELPDDGASDDQGDRTSD